MKKPMKLALAFAAVVSLTEPFWAKDEQTTKDTLKKAGLTATSVGNGSYTNYPWFQGGVDVYVTRFEAVNKDGQVVKGTVSNTPYIGNPSINLKP